MGKETRSHKTGPKITPKKNMQQDLLFLRNCVRYMSRGQVLD